MGKLKKILAKLGWEYTEQDKREIRQITPMSVGGLCGFVVLMAMFVTGGRLHAIRQSPPDISATLWSFVPALLVFIVVMVIIRHALRPQKA